MPLYSINTIKQMKCDKRQRIRRSDAFVTGLNSCQGCLFKAGDSEELIVHRMKTCEDVVTFKCPSCFFETYQQPDLVTHLEFER